MSKPTLTITKDFTDTFNDTIKRFKRDAILVGIPATDGQRESDEPGDSINNATILAINHFGSPANNIPPRQPMSIGIRNAQDDIAEGFRQCAVEALKTGPAALDKWYNRIGSITANSIKRVITTQEGLEEPSAATLKARKYLTQSGFKGTKALLVTGQLRNAITWVVNKWGV